MTHGNSSELDPKLSSTSHCLSCAALGGRTELTVRLSMLLMPELSPGFCSVLREASGWRCPWQLAPSGFLYQAGVSSPSCSEAEKTAWQRQSSLRARFILFLFKEILQTTSFFLAQCEDLGSEFIYVHITLLNSQGNELFLGFYLSSSSRNRIHFKFPNCQFLAKLGALWLERNFNKMVWMLCSGKCVQSPLRIPNARGRRGFLQRDRKRRNRTWLHQLSLLVLKPEKCSSSPFWFFTWLHQTECLNKSAQLKAPPQLCGVGSDCRVLAPILGFLFH